MRRQLRKADRDDLGLEPVSAVEIVMLAIGVAALVVVAAYCVFVAVTAATA
jgi:hypothetical protein